MRALAVLFLVSMSVSAYAEEQQNVKIPVKDGFQKLDMQGFQGAQGTSATTSPKTKTSVSIGCTDVTGRSFKAEDAGYQNCLMETKSRSGNPNDKGSNVNVQFGN
ncbi:hypothetical protein [Bdellovibrio sp. HCB209]|uniref:hypothetical protein n=1 Tax=Bdellovibrio sp. HCB209 TaxID=3394354 RepID=UPI0039B5796C